MKEKWASRRCQIRFKRRWDKKVRVEKRSELPDIGLKGDGPDCGIHVFWGNITTVHETASHVFPVAEYIATAYSSLRQEEAKSSSPHSYTTIRTLLSILRISAALARLRFSDAVGQSDVDEALRLMQHAQFKVCLR